MGLFKRISDNIRANLNAIDKLTVVDTGNGDGAARVSNDVTSLMATAPEMLKNVSGIDLDQLVKELISKKASETKATDPEPAE